MTSLYFHSESTIFNKVTWWVGREFPGYIAFFPGNGKANFAGIPGISRPGNSRAETLMLMMICVDGCFFHKGWICKIWNFMSTFKTPWRDKKMNWWHSRKIFPCYLWIMFLSVFGKEFQHCMILSAREDRQTRCRPTDVYHIFSRF